MSANPITCCQSTAISKLYKDETKQISLQLFNKNGTALNLNEYAIYDLYLYDERDIIIGEYSYPTISGKNEIIILQEQNTDAVIINQGKIAFIVDPTILNKAIIGNVFAEVHLTKEEVGGIQTKTVTSAMKLFRLHESIVMRSSANLDY